MKDLSKYIGRRVRLRGKNRRGRIYSNAIFQPEYMNIVLDGGVNIQLHYENLILLKPKKQKLDGPIYWVRKDVLERKLFGYTLFTNPPMHPDNAEDIIKVRLVKVE